MSITLRMLFNLIQRNAKPPVFLKFTFHLNRRNDPNSFSGRQEAPRHSFISLVRSQSLGQELHCGEAPKKNQGEPPYNHPEVTFREVYTYSNQYMPTSHVKILDGLQCNPHFAFRSEGVIHPPVLLSVTTDDATAKIALFVLFCIEEPPIYLFIYFTYAPFLRLSQRKCKLH